MSQNAKRQAEMLRAAETAQFKHPGVKGQTMFCPECLSEYKHVHSTAPAFCAQGHAPVQVRPAKHILTVTEVVQRFYVRNGMY